MTLKNIESMKRSFCTENCTAEVWMITQLSVLLFRSIDLSGKAG